MDPRMREDNGGEGAHKGRPYGDAGGKGRLPRMCRISSPCWRG